MSEHEPPVELWMLWDDIYGRWWPADEGPGNPLLAYTTETEAIYGATQAKEEYDIDCVPVRII